jgi:hypothetical protein
MPSIKEKMIQIINNQPDDSSYDEILQELSFVNMVNRGLNDSKNNKVTEHDTIKKAINGKNILDR